MELPELPLLLPDPAIAQKVYQVFTAVVQTGMSTIDTVLNIIR